MEEEEHVRMLLLRVGMTKLRISRRRMEEEDAMEELDSPHNTQEEGIMEERE